MSAAEGRPLVTSYKNRTLQGNWFEDRCSTASQDGSTSSKFQQTAPRVMPAAMPLEQQSSFYKTTKQTFDELAATAPRLASTKAPCMVVPANLECSLASHDRVIRSAEPGCTGTMAAAAEAQAALQFQTTYGRCFQTEREAAQSSRPEYFTLDRSHAMKGALRKDVFSAEHEAATSGRGGARGLFTRSAAEAGSLYGVSVFADEYASRPRGQGRVAGMTI